MENALIAFAVIGGTSTAIGLVWAAIKIINWVSTVNNVSMQTEYNRQNITNKVSETRHDWLKAHVEKLESAISGKAELAAQRELQIAVASLDTNIITKLDAHAAFVTKSAFTNFAISFTGIGTRVDDLASRADVFNTFIADLMERVEDVETWQKAMSTPAQPAPSAPE